MFPKLLEAMVALGSRLPPEAEALLMEVERQTFACDALLSSIPDFAYTFDRNGRFTYVNQALLDLWGMTLEQAMGKNFFELPYPQDLAEKLQRQIRQVIETGRRLIDETPYASPTGAQGYYEYIFSPVFGPDGDVLIVAGTTRDITERKRAEAALSEAGEVLRQSETKYRELAETLPQMVWTAGPEGAIDYMNSWGLEYTGLSPEIGDPSRVVHPDDLQKVVERWSQSLAAGEEFSFEFRLRRASDGAYRVQSSRGRPIRDSQGKVVRWLGTSIDVHDERELQRKIESLLASERSARTEAEAANSAKDRFLAVLSHELRTPLTPVGMLAAAMEADSRLPRDIRDDAEMIRRNVELETRLIDDLLDISRIRTGKLRVLMQPTDIHRLIGHAIETIQAELEEKRLVLHRSLEARASFVNADPARLQQALWNLLKNAVKFTPEAGDIFIRTRNHGAEIVVEVRDTGRGIAQEAQAHIFEPFEQGDADVTRRYGGLGLGLAIVKGVVDLHSGRIVVASEGRNTGTTFALSLPVCEPASVPGGDAETDDAPSLKEPLCILVVEDHVDTARTLVRLLRLDGMEVRWANDIAAAVKLAAATPFDVVVSDLGLPDGSGYDLMRLLGRSTPAIAMSGFGMEEDVRQSHEAGFREHLVKPVSLSELRQAIRRVVAMENEPDGVA